MPMSMPMPVNFAAVIVLLLAREENQVMLMRYL